MSGLDQNVLESYQRGGLDVERPLFIRFCRDERSRPKLNPLDDGLIYDCFTSQLLQWNGNRWEKATDGTPVRTLPFPQIEPKFAGVPRMGIGVTCIPGVWAGFPAPTFDFVWFIDGSQWAATRTVGGDPARFGGSADELALLKEGREIRCQVSATMPPPSSDVAPYRVSTFGQAISYVRPALPA